MDKTDGVPDLTGPDADLEDKVGDELPSQQPDQPQETAPTYNGEQGAPADNA